MPASIIVSPASGAAGSRPTAPWPHRYPADLASATLRGYRYDLRHFLAWHATVQPDAFALDHLAAYELIAYRQHMVAAGRRPATINRRLDALRRLCRWARSTGTLSGDVFHDLRPVRTVRNRQPAGLTDPEVHALLRAGQRTDPAWAPDQGHPYPDQRPLSCVMLGSSLT
jgi:site-specific recombinase XerD